MAVEGNLKADIGLRNVYIAIWTNFDSIVFERKQIFSIDYYYYCCGAYQDNFNEYIC